MTAAPWVDSRVLTPKVANWSRKPVLPATGMYPGQQIARSRNRKNGVTELLHGVMGSRRWNPHQQTDTRENVEQPLPPRYHATRPPCAPLPSRFAHGALRPVGHHACSSCRSLPRKVGIERWSSWPMRQTALIVTQRHVAPATQPPAHLIG